MRGAKLFQSLLYHWAPFWMVKLSIWLTVLRQGRLVEGAGEAVHVQTERR